MRINTRQPWIRSMVALLVVGLFAAATTGCEKSPKDKLRAAKVAVLNEQPDQAEEYLDAVLEAQPDSFEAKRLKGSVYELRGNYAKAEETLRALWDEQGFGDEAKKLSTQQESQKQRLHADLIDMYQGWAASLQNSDNPEKFEEVAKKGLALDKKKPRLNGMLVEFYQNRAKKLVEEGKKLEAADEYAKIPELVTSSDIRDNAKERAANLRFEVNKEEMLTFFNEKAKAKLEKADRYDAENKTISFTVEQDVDEVEKAIEKAQGQKVRLNLRNKEHLAHVHKFAIGNKLRPALVDVVVEATGIPRDANFDDVQPPKGFEIVETEVGRNDYSIKAKIPLDAVLKLGFEIKDQARKAKEEAADKKVADAKADAEPKAKAEAEQAGEKK